MNQKNNNDAGEREKRKQLLKSYIERLSAGEDLEVVRKEFVENFENVESSEIAQVEQELIMSGVPVDDVQRLCDVHSALFHGMTVEEQEPEAEGANDEVTAQSLRDISGHPLQIFMDENIILDSKLKDIKKLAKEDITDELLEKLRVLRLNLKDHYTRKGDLIYPLLSRTYDYSGPSDVMWGVDGEIRDDLASIVGLGRKHPDFKEVLERVLTRAEEMIYKENNILFPLCAELFSEEDWMRLYYEFHAYGDFLEEEAKTWSQAEEKREDLKVIGGKLARDRQDSIDMKEEIVLGSGHMNVEQILGVLNAIPMELTFIDEEDTNRFFSEDTPLFKRPDMAIGRDVHSCHPPKSAKLAKRVIEEFRDGTKDKFELFRYINDEPVYIRYLAVRDEDGKYLGTLEAVEELGYAEKHFSAVKRKDTNL